MGVAGRRVVPAPGRARRHAGEHHEPLVGGGTDRPSRIPAGWRRLALRHLGMALDVRVAVAADHRMAVQHRQQRVAFHHGGLADRRQRGRAAPADRAAHPDAGHLGDGLADTRHGRPAVGQHPRPRAGPAAAGAAAAVAGTRRSAAAVAADGAGHPGRHHPVLAEPGRAGGALADARGHHVLLAEPGGIGTVVAATGRAAAVAEPRGRHPVLAADRRDDVVLAVTGRPVAGAPAARRGAADVAPGLHRHPVLATAGGSGTVLAGDCGPGTVVADLCGPGTVLAEIGRTGTFLAAARRRDAVVAADLRNIVLAAER